MDEDRHEKRRPILVTEEEEERFRHMLRSWDKVEKMAESYAFTQKLKSVAGLWIKWLGTVAALVIAAKVILGDMREILSGWLRFKP